MKKCMEVFECEAYDEYKEFKDNNDVKNMIFVYQEEGVWCAHWHEQNGRPHCSYSNISKEQVIGFILLGKRNTGVLREI
jgi:hypothetical protein